MLSYERQLVQANNNVIITDLLSRDKWSFLTKGTKVLFLSWHHHVGWWQRSQHSTAKRVIGFTIHEQQVIGLWVPSELFSWKPDALYYPFNILSVIRSNTLIAWTSGGNKALHSIYAADSGQNEPYERINDILDDAPHWRISFSIQGFPLWMRAVFRLCYSCDGSYR